MIRVQRSKGSRTEAQPGDMIFYPARDMKKQWQFMNYERIF